VVVRGTYLMVNPPLMGRCPLELRQLQETECTGQH
jgi:hypothetical protein